jgi:hypothetical protein
MKNLSIKFFIFYQIFIFQGIANIKYKFSNDIFIFNLNWNIKL